MPAVAEVEVDPITGRVAAIREDVSKRFSEFRATDGVQRGGGRLDPLEVHAHVEDGTGNGGVAAVVRHKVASWGRELVKSHSLLRPREAGAGLQSDGGAASVPVAQDPGREATGGKFAAGGRVLLGGGKASGCC